MTRAEIEAVARAVHRGDWWDSDNLPIGDRRILLYREERDLGRYLARQAVEALDYVRGQFSDVLPKPPEDEIMTDEEVSEWGEPGESVEALTEREAVARVVFPGPWWDAKPLAPGKLSPYEKARSHGLGLARRVIEALDRVRDNIDPLAEHMTERERLSYEKGLWAANTIARNHALIPNDGRNRAYESGWRDAALEIEAEIEELITASRKARGLE